MDLRQKASEIYHADRSAQARIESLQQLEVDLRNEMDAQDQNMHPEISHQLAEAYRLTKNYLRALGA